MVALKVFGQPTSTDVARVLTCLFEKNLDFQLIRTDKFKGEPVVPEFLRLQDPTGQVIFKDGKFMIFVDSRDACRHISEKYPDMGNKTLFGTGVLERATIEQWLQAEARMFDPPSSTLVFHLAFATPLGLHPDQSLIERNEKKLADVLDIYESRLGEDEYLAGDEFTLADLSHLPNAHYLVTKTERGRKLFTSRKNVARWWKAISDRPSWKRVVQIQSEHPSPLEKLEN
ncbi:glutathione S-transferase F10-like [Phoenix dactylifera]|uniref:glutathione transferase n=1 Tax=Phoenix dactylifera TaxID=42345 RepID=A0A8B8ZN16_PHODC|nr:glutathione S-transferase F10-like [Phoenix dactylifera]XP_038974727.1 glutathione S-transferase F10-like [Phoenix dactylifera]